jgi:hypothetical protein
VPVAYVHVSCFSFDNDAGLTGGVEISKTDTLINMIVTSGFLTSDEPIRVRWSTPAPCVQSSFSWSAAHVEVHMHIAFFGLLRWV